MLPVLKLALWYKDDGPFGQILSGLINNTYSISLDDKTASWLQLDPNSAPTFF
jgi:hypothetical protein